MPTPFFLAIGSNKPELPEWAKETFVDIQLLTNENVSNIDSYRVNAFYTSLIDMDEDKIVKIAARAREVHYWPPKDDNLRTITELFLTKLIRLHKIKVKNFILNRDPANSLSLADRRKTGDPQIWVAGCSYARGFGLPSVDDRYVSIVANAANMQFSDLTEPGSSIDWAADQLLRSDIRPNDIVLWGITGINRCSYYVNDQYQPVLPAVLSSYQGRDLEFYSRLILDNNRLNQGVKCLYQVVNYLKKINAELIILFHEDLSLGRFGQSFQQYLWNVNNVIYLDSNFLDRVVDGHPGPETNRVWAEKILNIIASLAQW